MTSVAVDFGGSQMVDGNWSVHAARACVGVTALARDALVEIDFIAKRF